MLISSAACLQDTLIDNVRRLQRINTFRFWQYSWIETLSPHFSAASFLGVRNFFHEQRRYFRVAITLVLGCKSTLLWGTPIGWTRGLRVLKARLHMRFLIRFLRRFRVQNAPDPTLHESLFREASCGLERKVSHIILRHPSFEFLPTWRYFVAALRDYKPVRGRLGQVLCAKSHQNRIENRMCKRA